MNCSDVRKALLLESIPADEAEAVRRHVAACAECRNVKLLFADVDESLKRQFLWEPPAHFVASVVSTAAPELSTMPAKPRILPADILYGTILALLMIAITAVSALILIRAGLPLLVAMAEHLLPVAWGAALLTLCFSLWMMRRALR